jgi:membrane protein YqaA with SNARE-associated domain
LNSLSAHLGLFATAVLSATLLPGSSEALLVALVALNPNAAPTLLLVATFGNTFGAVINWILGRWLLQYVDAPWFPIDPQRLAQASEIVRTYGIWTLLFSWVPVFGDPLTFAAGLLRVPFPVFVTLVCLGKAARYIVLIGGVRLFQNLTIAALQS